MPKREATAWNKAMDLLSRRPCSAKELAAKLIQAGFAADEVRATLDKCVEHHFIDDAMFANDNADLLLQRGCGKRKIAQTLRAKGIDEALISETLQRISDEDNELDAAKSALEYKLRLLRNESDARKKKDKVIRFLISRGFSLELAISMWEKFGQGSDEEFYE